jgi:hypothetical protein
MAKRAPRFKLSAPITREPVLHRQIADVLRLEIAPPGRVSSYGVVWWSVDMANYGGKTPGLRTLRGCIAGIADMQVLFKGLAHFIELKAWDGELSPEQCAVATDVLIGGSRFGVVRDAREMLALLDAWEIPRSRVTHL